MYGRHDPVQRSKWLRVVTLQCDMILFLPLKICQCPTVPGDFKGTSSYALLPFYTPKAAQGILKGNGVIDKYDTTRPPNGYDIVSVQTQEGCKKVFEDRDAFVVMYQAAIRNCTDGHDFMIGWDEQKKHDQRSEILHRVFFEDGFEKNINEFFTTNVRDLIKKNSLKGAKGRMSIDIVRDVTNITPILWLAERFALPLKTEKQPRGLLSIHEAFLAYLVLCELIFFTNIVSVN